MNAETRKDASVRVLAENEIQERLYGPYLGRRSNPAAPSSPAVSSETVWTGSQILTGEVQRLRSELISLRQEKEQLAAHLRKMHSSSAGSGVGWIGRWLGILLLSGVAGYWISGGMLQAAPPGGWEATPYTVQVAVYDGPVMATRTEALLRELGYDAFLVEHPRGNGQVRYRVYVGSFVTKEEARMESNRLTADPRFRDFKDAFVLVR